MPKFQGTYEERFWSHVDKSGDCWLWTASLTKGGYGQFKSRGVMARAHRISWEIAQGPISSGICVCHTCDVRHCVNPDHLFLGTYEDNNADRHRKGRSAGPQREAHPCAKLTEKDADSIRSLHKQGLLYREISAIFGVCISTVGNVVRGEAWA